VTDSETKKKKIVSG